jgi:hypothetical protein
VKAEETDANYVWAETIERFTRGIRNLFLTRQKAETPERRPLGCRRALDCLAFSALRTKPGGCPHCNPVGSPRLPGFLDDNHSTDSVVKRWVAKATAKRVSSGGALRQSFTSCNFNC